MEYRGYKFRIDNNGYYHNYKVGSLHRYKWLKELGPIPKDYVVHHKDEDTLNNSISNLMMLTNSEHASLHQKKRVGSLAPMYGKNHSNKTKMILSICATGKNNARSKKIRNIETGEVFESCHIAHKKYGSQPIRAANGTRKTAAGYHWEFVS